MRRATTRQRSPGRALWWAALAASLLASPGALADDGIEVAIHHAYGTNRLFTIEGRVFQRREGREVRPGDRWYVNLRRTLHALRQEERPGAPLQVSFAGRTWDLSGDDEGYFALRGETPPRVGPGWQPVRVRVVGDPAAAAVGELLVVPDGGTVGIISDVDDTVVVSEVGDRSRLLTHTFLENPLQRRAVPGVASSYRGFLARNLRPEAAPVIYLTASPRQFLPAIRQFLEAQGFPRGPIIAKKVTDGSGGDPLLDQERYKTERIEAILADLPEVKFILSGDDGERDPEVYRRIRERHPGRIEAVYIRRVSGDPGRPVFQGQEPLP
jgi:phosphatidate phosphatase APP1